MAGGQPTRHYSGSVGRTRRAAATGGLSISGDHRRQDGGLVAAMAIFAALTGRYKRTCASSEMPMFECMVGFNLLEHLCSRQLCPRSRMSYPRVLTSSPPLSRRQVHYMLPYTDAHWHAFFVSWGGRARG